MNETNEEEPTIHPIAPDGQSEPNIAVEIVVILAVISCCSCILTTIVIILSNY